MKTLVVNIADLEDLPQEGRVTVTAEYTGDVVLTSGKILTAAPKAKKMGRGRTEFEVFASDDPLVKTEYQGFAIKVTATLKVGNSQHYTLTRTVKPLQAMSSPISFGTLPPAEPLPNDWATVSEVVGDFDARLDALEAGGGGGSDSLIPVAGGAHITLPTADEGDLFGYSLAGSAFVNDAALAAGDYVFRKTATGWDYRKLADSTVLAAVPDTTPPTAGTLTSSTITDVGFTLTASGAADNKALHSSPYAFSLDGGATWSAWQASAIYVATGRTASTAYSCRHKVRDASANTTTGAAISVTTSALPPPTLPITDTFTAADGTAVNGRAVGGFAWSSDTTAVMLFHGQSPAPSATISGGAAVSTTAMRGAMIDVLQPHVRVSAKLTITSGVARIGFGNKINGAGGQDGIYVTYIPGEGFKVYHGNNASPVQLGTTYTGAGTGAQAALTVSIEWNGTTATAKVGGTTIATGTVSLGGGTKAGFYLSGTAGISFDDFTVEAV